MRAGLLVDVGNSRAKWGRVRNGAWVAHGQLETNDLKHLPVASDDRHVVASNVAGVHAAALLTEASSRAGIALRLVESSDKLGTVSNRYHDPRQLGSDRWAALIGAHHSAPGSRLVVLAGTATTVDALTAEGEFLGGLILPGLQLMRTVLTERTAQLAVPAGQFAEFPRSTPDAIASGAIAATLGAIEIQLRRLAALTSVSPPPMVIVSGGAAPALLPHLPLARHQEHVVLEGLLAIARLQFPDPA